MRQRELECTDRNGSDAGLSVALQDRNGFQGESAAKRPCLLPKAVPPAERRCLERFVGRSAALCAAIQSVVEIAACDLTVLIEGETGTGKEICARAIHDLSPRHTRPFVALNCAGLSAELAENELFGHASGAYTSANSSSEGLVSLAQGGTLFLDEIDSLSPAVQPKLLRFLQDKTYRPVGSQKFLAADVRIIASTRCDLETEVRQGRFREDLFFRLEVLKVVLPPLRKRPEDIELLADHFLPKYAAEVGKSLAGFSPDAVAKLRAYD